MERCISDVDITAYRLNQDIRVGGIAGYVDSRLNLTDCACMGSVQSNGDGAGGIVGALNTIGTHTNVYFGGSVSAASNVGVFYGKAYNGVPTLNNCYYLSTCGSTANAGVATSKTAAEMQTSEFAEALGAAWSQNASVNGGYPYPVTQSHMITSAIPPERSGSWSTYTNTDWYGDGSKLMYSIDTPAELAGLAELVNAGNDFSKHIILLGDDLDLSAHYWTPIGTSSYKFKGVFDGQGHTISGLTIDSVDATYQGLFGYTSAATLQNICLTDVNIAAKSYVGALTAYTDSYTLIRDCEVSGVISSNNGVFGKIGMQKKVSKSA